MKPQHLSAIVLMACGVAWGDTVDILGQKLTFSNPSGYCTLGNTQPERDLLNVSQRSVGLGSCIIHVAVRCSELAAFKRGIRDELDHWLQIQLIGSKGDFKRMEIGRETFLAAIAKVSPRLDTAEISRRIKSALADTDVSMTNMQVAPLGRDGNAAYFSLRMNLSTRSSSRPVTGLSVITLVNSLPLTINVYEGTGTATGREQLQPTLQLLLLSVLTEN